jgi:hypothetical protein
MICLLTVGITETQIFIHAPGEKGKQYDASENGEEGLGSLYSYPVGLPRLSSPHTRRGPGCSPQIRDNNPLDFSDFLVIISQKVQFWEGDFSGEQGTGLLPLLGSLINCMLVLDFI